MTDARIIIRNEASRTTNTVAPASPQHPNILDKNPTSGLVSLNETVKLLSEKQISKVVENATVLECLTGPNNSVKSKYTIAHLNSVDPKDPEKQYKFEDILIKARCAEYDEGVRQNPEDILQEYFGKGVSASEAIDSSKNNKDKNEALRKYYKSVADHLTFAPLVSNGIFSKNPKPGDKVRLYYFQDPRVSSGEPIAGFYEKMYNENIFENISSNIREILSKYRQKFINDINSVNNITESTTSNIPTLKQQTSEQSAASAVVEESYKNNQTITDLNELRSDFKEIIIQLINSMKANDIPFIVNETYRSPQRQLELYEKGREKNPDGTYTVVGPVVTYVKESGNHSNRTAIDFRLDTNKTHPYWIKNKYEPKNPWDTTNGAAKNAWFLLGKEAKKLGLIWGGDWSMKKDSKGNKIPIKEGELGFDPPHIEMKG